MLDKEALRKALTRRDVRQIRQLLARGPDGPEDGRALLALIKQSGTLVGRYGKAPDVEVQKSIVDAATDYLDSLDLNFLRELTSHVTDATLLNLIFRRIKEVLRQHAVSALSPGEQAWSVIHWASAHTSSVHRRALQPPTQSPFLIRAGEPTIQNEGAKPLDIDELLAGSEEYLRMTLSMLAFENDWWDETGKLCLPPWLPSNPAHVRKAGSHIFLASVWDLVTDASETLRFWGDVIALDDIPVSEDSREVVEALVFNLNLVDKLYFAVARMRMIQMELDVEMAKIGIPLPEFKDPYEARIEMPPNGFVSAEEISTAVLLDMLFHYQFNASEYPGGLSPAKLVRGYAVLKRCFEKPFESTQSDTIRLDRAKILQALKNCSLTSDEADLFLSSVTFGRDSRDLFDCPIVRCGSTEEYVLSGFVRFVSIPRAAVSQLSLRRMEFPNKGIRFEQQVRELFAENGIAAKELQFSIGSEEYQIDVVAAWKNVVFLFECKNYLLPPPSATQEFYFMESMDEAIDQVLRLKSALELRPSQLSEAFSDLCADHQIVLVVLNAMPFSLDSSRRGVFLYDYSALNRFFAGEISVNQPIYSNGEWIQVQHVIKRLWKGSVPEPSDLIAQMTSPIQLEAELPRWYTDKVTVGMTNSVAMQIPVLRKKEMSSADMMKALQVDDRVAKLVNEVSGGLHRRFGNRRRRKRRKK